jgi:hypothetical protein
MLSKWWEFLDFTSIEAKLYIHGKYRYKTKFGSLMSVLSLIAVSVLSIYFMVIFLQKKDVSLLFFQQSKYFQGYLDMNKQPFFWRLNDLAQNPMDSRVVSVVPTFLIWDSKSGLEINYLETQNCSTVSHFQEEKMKEMLKSYDMTQYTCIKENKYNLNLTMDLNNGNYNFINIYINTCKNSTENKNHCKPQKEIDEILEKTNFYIQWSFPSYTIDHLNITNPVMDYFEYVSNKIYPSMFYIHNINIKTVNYTDDQGAVMEDLRSFTTWGKDPLTSYVEIGGKGTKSIFSNALAYYTFMLNANVFDSFKRTYPKLQTLVANIGGVIKFIVTLAQFFSRYVSEKMLSVHLANYFADLSEHGGKGGEIKETFKTNSNLNQLPNNTNNLPNPHNEINYSVLKNNNNSNFNLNNSRIFNTGGVLNEREENILGNINLNSKRISIQQSNTKENNKINMSKITTIKIEPKIIHKINDNNFKILSFTHAILPRCFIDSKSPKLLVSQCERILRANSSIDHILKISSDIENFKRILLTTNQRVLFSSIKKPTLLEHLDLLKSTIDNDGEFLNIHYDKIENIVSQMVTSENPIDKILLELI